MTHEIRLPAVSEGVTEGIVVGIVVAVGDQVDVAQTLLELETDKAVIDIPSPLAGVITEIRVTEGDSVVTDAVIMVLEAAGTTVAVEAETPAEEQSEAKPDTQVVAEPEPEPEPEPEAAEYKPEPESPAPAAPLRPTAAVVASEVDLLAVRRGERVAPAAPSVRRLARDLGVDIYQVQGTGPGGRIGEADLRNFVSDTMQRIAGGSPLSGQPAQRPLPDFSRWGEVSREPLSRVRELTAAAMSYAWSTIPMVTQYDHARIGEIETFRKEFNLKADNENRLTMTAILVKICAAALKEFPRFNCSLDLARKELILKQSVHIGVAVETDGGLLVPVLRDADQKGVERLAVELNEMAGKTRERKISPADMEGGGFTISNLGGVGGTSFAPIVYAPQVAILGVSTAEMQPVWSGREFNPDLVLPLSLTYDHRVIDGADSARFLRWICTALEHPLQLVMKG
jgi:pyruvate dehydrogenase E2 component (dihydrolipoamide acetyltransferase)